MNPDLYNSEKREILKKFALDVRQRYYNALDPINATLKSKKSIKYTITNEQLLMTAGEWFPAIDEGRSRRRTPTDKGFFEAIKWWIARTDNFSIGPNVNLNHAARRLQWLINKYGTGHGPIGKKLKLKRRINPIIKGVQTYDLQRQLKIDIGRLGAHQVETVISEYNTKSKFVKVTVTKVR